jgi:hypothetical protein
MVRPIDAYTLNNELVSWYNDTEDGKEKSILRRVMQMVVHAPTLTPPNKPLTLEQLREMDGEPVWVEQQAAWGLVEVHKNRVYIIGLDFESGYSLHWNIYRRPPEGEADA